MNLIRKELLTLIMAEIRNYSSTFLISVSLTLFGLSCANFKAYFNTFYNAEEYFKQAEISRIENQGLALPKFAKENYEKVIEKATTVLDEYPEFNKRKSAYLMLVQSQFHLEKYREANFSLQKMDEEFKKDSKNDYIFWASMIKWKEGKVQPAIDDLENLLNAEINEELKVKVFMAVAEIYFDQNMTIVSMNYLEQAALKSQKKTEKGQIYTRIADLSFADKDYDRALVAYQEVIKYSQSKKHIQEAHLRSVQIYRLQDKLEMATNLVKEMLLDENYTNIYNGLELELAKLYQRQGMELESRNRLESIVQDYQQTKESSEAYFMLGEIFINQEWDLETALKHFEMVGKEFKGSAFLNTSNIRIKEINAYLKTYDEYQIWMERITKIDSSGNYQLTIEEETNLASVLYGMAELELFHFGRKDSGVTYLDELIDKAPRSSLMPKALFAKSSVHFGKGDYITANALRDRIVNEYPKTDYAFAVIKKDSTFSSKKSISDRKLLTAEKKWIEDPILGIDNYKEIVSSDTISEASVRAALFLAHQYDYQISKIDSAIKYYEWIIRYHQGSEQASFALKRVNNLNLILSESTVNDAN